MERIDPLHLVYVTGGAGPGGMPFDPGLNAALSAVTNRKRPPKVDPAMQQATLAVGTALSNLTTGMGQAQQQSRQAMQQMLPQMLGR